MPDVSPFDAAMERLSALHREHFVNDEDCWYSCPASGQCCNDELGNECNCGANERNAVLDAALATIRADRAALIATIQRQEEALAAVERTTPQEVLDAWGRIRWASWYEGREDDRITIDNYLRGSHV